MGVQVEGFEGQVQYDGSVERFMKYGRGPSASTPASRDFGVC